MRFPSKEIVERIRREYPAGTRVELLRMDNPQAPPIGTQGTVMGVDDIAPSWSPGTTAAAFPWRSEKTCAGRSRTHQMVVKWCKLHNILRSSLCSILSKMALLLSSFRANMCTPKGKTTPNENGGFTMNEKTARQITEMKNQTIGSRSR